MENSSYLLMNIGMLI